MTEGPDQTIEILLIIAPRFNMAATVDFLDPFRAANYLQGQSLFAWRLCSLAGGPVVASNRLSIDTEKLSDTMPRPDLAVVSSSWTPEAYGGPALAGVLRRWARFGATLGGIDTGAFILAAAGLLDGRRATVHYEHLDAFAELYPNVEASEDLYVVDDDRLSASGAGAAVDLALQVIRATRGEALANAAARYIFHERIRPPGSRQNPEQLEPVGATAPLKLKHAIQVMEKHLEEPARISAIATEIGLSTRQLERLFADYVYCSPQQYYRNIRLDRARGLVTQTEMPMWEVALACGFSSPEHFSRAYRVRFGIPPRTDRIEGRVPFEFRAWPMHAPKKTAQINAADDQVDDV